MDCFQRTHVCAVNIFPHPYDCLNHIFFSYFTGRMQYIIHICCRAIYSICVNWLLCYLWGCQSTLLLVVKSGGSQVMCGFLTVWSVKESESESRSVVSDSLWFHELWVHGILQVRMLEWVAFPFSRGSSQPNDWNQISCIAGWILYQLSHKGNPRILEWVAYPFSSRSSWPRNRTGISCTAGGFPYQLSSQESPVGGVSTSNSSRCSKVNSICCSNSL